MKTTLRNIVIAIAVLFVVVAVLYIVGGPTVTVGKKPTQLRVYVVDTDGVPVIDARVCVDGVVVNSDVTGTANIVPKQLSNRYDDKINEWFTADVVVVKDGFVPTVVVGCVMYTEQTRKLTVRIYAKDSSELPVVTYVESPPPQYLDSLINAANGN